MNEQLVFYLLTHAHASRKITIQYMCFLKLMLNLMCANSKKKLNTETHRIIAQRITSQGQERK